jgi:hypothetical protein
MGSDRPEMGLAHNMAGCQAVLMPGWTRSRMEASSYAHILNFYAVEQVSRTP